ncbi:MAG TPA: DinB family protein [Longimicrobiales bacterium]|nr:DinB family protein [Longimicrobiales bacterium]
MSGLERPGPDERGEYWARYIELVPDGDVLETLRDQLGETLALLQEVPRERETYRYEPGKWSIRQVVGHLLDAERVFAHRALTIARSDDADLPGMDQDEWAERSNAGSRSLDDLAAEWAGIRRANLHMFATLGPEAGMRRGRASGHEFTVRSFPWIIAGHELWHRQLLERDYLGRSEGETR